MLLLTLALLIIFVDNSEAKGIKGQIKDDSGYSLAGVQILLKDFKKGAVADINGDYSIAPIEAGNYTLIASFLGYKTVEQKVIVPEGEWLDFNIEMELDPIAMEELIIKAEKASSTLTVDEPVRTEIISAEELQQSSTDGSLLSALSQGTGLNTKPCALCGSAGVGMQGLDPSYTEITVDGLPTLSGVGALYGMDAFMVSDLSRVDLVKGSGTSRSGSGAMAGSVNLISANPEEIRSMSLSSMGGTTTRHNISGSLTYPISGVFSRLSVNYASEPQKLDYNDDGVTDSPQYNRLNLALLTTQKFLDGDFRIGGRFFTENRFAGETGWTESDQGSADVYGRDINTNRGEVSFRYSVTSRNKFFWSIESAFVNHEQKSWYGTTQFDASQVISVSKLTFEKHWNVFNSTVTQLVNRYEDYSDNLNLASETDRLDQVPGVVLQHTWTPDDRWMFSFGSRNEHYQEDGIVVNPRGSIRFQPTFNWTLLAAVGTGYRPVTIFSLDKAAHAGFDNIVVPESLDPERSVNSSFTLNYRKIGIKRSFQVDMTGFYNQFSNKVVLEFADHAVGSTVYSNALEAFSRGAEIQLSVALGNDWLGRIGSSYTDVQYRNSSGWHYTHLQSRYMVNTSLTRNWDTPGVTLSAETKTYGPQELPEGRERSESPVYTVVNARVSKAFDWLTVTASIDNLTNYVQPDEVLFVNPITGERKVDSALIYGPQLGRIFLINLSTQFDL